MLNFVRIARPLAAALLLVLVALPSPARGQDLLGRVQERAAREALVGTWRASVGEEQLELELAENGSFRLQEVMGTFEVAGRQLVLFAQSTVAYDYTFEAGRLTLSGGDLESELVLTRSPRVPGYVTGVWSTSPEALGKRLHRIVWIVGIVVVARLAIWFLGWLSGILIFSSWGPLALLYRHDKNRARTIHSLALNVVKYFIYLTALGMVLNELGIQYTTYFASLSVVGLAIGFGSQGLVQDMVTGFFIVFENQYDVGDMIEISGQSGYVTELGLRTTKLRNYLGQIVVIPNRIIATVANYSRGAQRAYIDVALVREEDAPNALKLLKELGTEMQRQYDGVLLPPIRTTGPTVLATGEVFVRLHVSLWPGQTWIVDQQLVPRIRERLAAGSIELLADRVVPYYHAKQIIETSRWRRPLTWIRSRGKKRPAPEPPRGMGGGA